MSFDNTQAFSEGWAVFECHGSSHGPWQIQHDDEAGLFPNDGAAWLYVFRAASGGSPYHQGALRFLRERNPQEYVRITDHFLRTVLTSN